MMSDRKAELERKKAKLQAIREEKERRRREKEQKDVEEATVRAAGADKDHRKEIDAMLSSLGMAPVSDVLSSLSSMNSLTPEQSANATPDASLQPSSINSTQSTGRRKPRELTIVSVANTNIPPKEPVVYSKQTQTVQTTHTSHDGLSKSSSEYTIYSSCSTTTPTHSCSAGYFETDWWRPRKAEDEENSLPHLDSFQSKLPPGILPHGLPQVKEVQPAVTQVEQEKEKEKPKKEVREFSEEEKQMIILSEDFQRFLDRTSRIVERALGESIDIYTDYTGTMDGEDGLDEKSHQQLWLNRSFFCERWSRNRCVTSMDWSPQFPELLAASYNNNDDTPNDPDGVCLVWNTKFKKSTPEFIFHCQSPVMSTTFAKFHPNLILGGTYSGQIVLWDNRVQKRTPVQRTPLSASAHTHPVYCLTVVGTQNAHNLISISTDGKLCSWSLDMLSQPQETLILYLKQSKTIAATCLAFPHGDVNNFVVGSEDGTVYGDCRHGTKAGVVEMFEGHQGPVTGISTHAVQGGIDFSHLFLTSSIDWTIKLWSLKEMKPLYSFEHNGDYVYDVAWSPTHPALFAAVDDSGRLDLWNLNQDTEVPAASVIVDGNPALNRVSWTPSGLHVTVGDDTGKIWVYDVAEHLAYPRSDEWNKFLYTQQDLKNNKADEELDRLNLSSGPSSLTSLTSISSCPLR
ncbi:cytoplasmic dynein 1 intermediate chain-like isoform X18 [Vespa mandarinia]|uniref:cytoplasmic dynein 1 intermediate chain-like isoform X18 n=1 Tax=Vespa mandarinia TaxID=7446 RepID=UPI001613FF37|nr:cytoplasmic dynein 1 intermediate chain-like isoform X18 [Vespa mandarinia]XP_046821309.1 cytoplasmic dynein 1 intermediate chain isoform X18 [Vespa crabro]XP_047349313.1 cytoplasmic dynein 1 intermediate chain isoform X19 [Vespa velutina]